MKRASSVVTLIALCFAAVGLFGAEAEPHPTLLGASHDGVFRSTDGGWTWRQVGDEIADARSFAVADETVYVGTYNSGVYWSHDKGETWERTGLPTKRILAVAADGALVFAGGHYTGLFRSEDYGTTWASLGFSEIAIRALAVYGEHVYIGTSGDGLLRMTLDGNEPGRVDNGLKSRHVSEFAVADDAIFLATNPIDPEGKQVYWSSCGALWVPVGPSGDEWDAGMATSEGIRSIAALSGDLVYAVTNGSKVMAIRRNGDEWAADWSDHALVKTLCAADGVVYGRGFGSTLQIRANGTMMTGGGGLTHMPDTVRYQVLADQATQDWSSDVALLRQAAGAAVEADNRRTNFDAMIAVP